MPRARTASRGAMLIDVLVGLSVGALVVGAAAALLQTARETASTVNETGLLQQQSAQALRAFRQQLLPAGSTELAASAGKTGGFRLFALSVEEPEPVLGKEGGKKGSDSVRVVRIAPPLLAQQYDCLGQKIGSGGRMEATFEVDAKGVLRCKGALNQPQPLIDGVHALELRYRVRQAGQVRDLPAAEVEAQRLWPSVIALQVCLDLRGEVRSAAYERRYVDCTGQQASSRGLLHLVTRRLFGLRAPSPG